MTEEMSFLRYLAAKKPIDDRSLNQHVWRTLTDEITARRKRDGRLRVLEIGAGSGTMIERMLAVGLLTSVDYTAVDLWPEGVDAIPARLAAWANTQGWTITQGGGEIVLTSPDGTGDVHVRTVNSDALSFAANAANHGKYDLLVAHAVLDLFDIREATPSLLRTLHDDGLCYFSVNFDGITAFLPSVNRSLDDQIEQLYHRSMDERITDGKRSGDHRAGRHLLALLQQIGVDVLAAGSSDWVVHSRGGQYPGDEAYFLRHILHFVESTLTGHPELDAASFYQWLQTRHAQIDRGELIYIAHQIDVLGRK
ncbi:methyltransferase domain-containing protein [bacterium]|nr:methyltransferase domain-containing protein [bacterium]